jgi:UV excision repair protein RAD23
MNIHLQLVPPEHAKTVENIESMGYPREEVIRALRVAFWDADRAVEYLCNGIPEGLSLNDAGVLYCLFWVRI